MKPNPCQTCDPCDELRNQLIKDIQDGKVKLDVENAILYREAPVPDVYLPYKIKAAEKYD